MKCWAAALACGISIVVSAGGAGAAPTGFQHAPCPEGIFPPTLDVDCGYVTVPESRARPNGRTIHVAAAIVHAPAARRRADPIVFLDGGPSFGAISPFAMDAYFADAAYVQNRDVILVDTRGTGVSAPRLGCPEFDEADRSSFYSRPFVGSSFDEDFTEALHACHDRLTDAGIDLSAYNSAEGAADLEALRTALGYRQWNLWAISADGVLGLTYMRLYPAAVRSAVLDSPVAPQAFDSVDYIRGTKEMLERALAGCAANAACESTYPNLRGVLYDIVHELQRHPAQISIPRFPGGPIVVQVRGVEFYLDAAFAVDPENIQHLFSEIWRSAHGELAQVYRERLSEAPFFDSDLFVARGKTMSYLCHDGLALYTPTVLQQLAADIPELASLVLSPGFGLPNGPAGCSIWDVGTADPAQHQPVSSRIPTLVTAGEFDLGVPPLMVRQVPGRLSNSRYFEFPATFHLQLASYNPVAPCAQAIATQFLDAPTRRPDSRCFAQLPQFDYTP